MFTGDVLRYDNREQEKALRLSPIESEPIENSIHCSNAEYFSTFTATFLGSHIYFQSGNLVCRIHNLIMCSKF